MMYTYQTSTFSTPLLVVQYTRTVTDRETMVSVRSVRTDRDTNIRIVEKG